MSLPDASSANPKSDRQQLALVAGCFLLSGFAALLYETVWLRQFSINFGTSEQALGIVLGTYMGGLAIGSLIASRLENRITRPLLTYGLLELGIAITALMVPFSLGAVRAVQIYFFGGGQQPPAAGEPSQILFAFMGAFAATILPTAMMGATLPMLAKHVVHNDEHLGNRIGALYAINTLGAVFGTLACAFVCLPRFGLSRTIWIGAAVNVAVFGIVWLLFRSQAGHRTDHANEPSQPTAVVDVAKSLSDSEGEGESRNWILWLIGLSGAISFAYEILFTRMLGHILGGSIFAFASMLSAFLLGIAIGGAIAACIARRASVASIGFFYAQCGTMLLTLGSWYSLEALAGHINAMNSLHGEIAIPRAAYAILILLPPAITIGMTFPWAIRIHARGEQDAAKSAAKVYAWSTAGGVTGAIVTGTYLLPLTNYQLAMTIALVANLVIALTIFFLASLKRSHLVMLVVAVVVGIFARPNQPLEILTVSSMDGYVRQGQLAFVKTGRSATVTVHDKGGTYLVSTNGLPEAGISPKGSIIRHTAAAPWLGMLPALLRPNAKTMLVVGFGAGVAPSYTPRSIREIDVFELEEGVIEANRIAASERDRNPLSDLRVNVILNDGRSGLALTKKKYDVIVSQPSHPWTAGASHLYTYEFAELAKDHLTDDGVFVLWMDMQFTDPAIVGSLGATLGDIYTHVSLFCPNESTLLFVGSPAPLDLLVAAPEPRSVSDKKRYQQLNADPPFTLPAVLGLDDPSLRKLSQGSRVTTDNNNLLALRQFTQVEQDVNREETITLLNQHDPLLKSDAPWTQEVDLSIICLRRFSLGRVRNAETLAKTIKVDSDRFLTQGFIAAASEQPDVAKELFQKSLDADPSNEIAIVMHALQSDESDETFSQLRSKLSPTYVALLELRDMVASKDFSRAPIVDEQLAKMPESNPLFGMTSMLRVHWRDAEKSSSAVRIQRSKEILELLSELDPFFPEDMSLQLMRVKHGAVCGKYFVALAAAQEVAHGVQRQITPTEEDKSAKPQEKADVGAMRTNLLNCLMAIAPIENNPHVPAYRFYGVRLQLATQLEVLEKHVQENLKR